MQIKKVMGITFSPTGHTREVIQRIATAFDPAHHLHDLGSYEMGGLSYQFEAQDLVIVGVPVYGGRIPALAAQRLKQVRGNRTPAIIVVTYGNRAYEDALLELKNLLENNRFVVIGAAAVVTEHSIVHAVGRDRPDSRDWAEIDQFKADMKQKLEQATDDEPFKSVAVSGTYPYRKYNGIPLKPKANQDCTSCGFCARECPAHAIDEHNPKHTDKKRCISCMRCVTYCPQQARSVNKLLLMLVSHKMEKACRARRENVFSE